MQRATEGRRSCPAPGRTDGGTPRHPIAADRPDRRGVHPNLSWADHNAERRISRPRPGVSGDARLAAMRRCGLREILAHASVRKVFRHGGSTRVHGGSTRCRGVLYGCGDRAVACPLRPRAARAVAAGRPKVYVDRHESPRSGDIAPGGGSSPGLEHAGRRYVRPGIFPRFGDIARECVFKSPSDTLNPHTRPFPGALDLHLGRGLSPAPGDRRFLLTVLPGKGLGSRVSSSLQ
jgi:hypothetical protein